MVVVADEPALPLLRVLLLLLLLLLQVLLLLLLLLLHSRWARSRRQQGLQRLGNGPIRRVRAPCGVWLLLALALGTGVDRKAG